MSPFIHPSQLCEHVRTAEAMSFLAHPQLTCMYYPEGHPASLCGQAVFFQKVDDGTLVVLHGLGAELSQVPSQP